MSHNHMGNMHLLVLIDPAVQMPDCNVCVIVQIGRHHNACTEKYPRQAGYYS